MAESPTKRRKLSLSDSSEGGGVVLTAQMRPRPHITMLSPTSMPRDESDEDRQPVTIVVESDAQLCPDDECLKFASDKDNVNTTRPYARTCHHSDCALEEARSRHSRFRLRSLDPVADLKRLLVNSNISLDGEQLEVRDELRRLQRERHYTNDDLRTVLVFAVQQAVLCHISIESMREYLSRWPYRFWFHKDPADDADDPSTYPDGNRIARMSNRELWDHLCTMAVEVDYLRFWEEGMLQTILEKKWEEAKEGNVREIEDLMRLGFVDKAMVTEHCGVPDG
ncbi:hypothetical protein CKM354_000782000 [Cercospora kikuchii]|uniref:Uncharacterized protein n=1 Tax=Cercospora kikuchii TaxID=84275 RepID=A0A9P3FEP5_9PEZI|nr:uncharacterized protein CKM354_000782000 [Cercospora kikuchii]GIZ44628.1 hypothetical protein CKM354_000782000 [Cercospora kikuchii]